MCQNAGISRGFYNPNLRGFLVIEASIVCIIGVPIRKFAKSYICWGGPYHALLVLICSFFKVGRFMLNLLLSIRVGFPYILKYLIYFPYAYRIITLKNGWQMTKFWNAKDRGTKYTKIKKIEPFGSGPPLSFSLLGRLMYCTYDSAMSAVH